MYRDLRASGVFSYDRIVKIFQDHQAYWPEAIFNEDAWVKYITPLVDPVTVDEDTGELIRTDRYLTMLQGSKEEQRKWWIYNRSRYLDSKNDAGNATANIINIRFFNDGVLRIKMAIPCYAAVSFGGGTTPSMQRVDAGEVAAFPYVAPTGVTEMETWIHSANLVTEISDLSIFYPNECDFSKATLLRRLPIGNPATGYSNANLVTIDVRNSPLLEYLDCRNCPRLGITVNLENSPRLTEAYFDGTSITGVDLADGCIIEHLHLPDTVTTLTLLNLRKLTDFVLNDYSNITRVMLANIDQDIVDPSVVLQAIPANSQVNIQGMYLELATKSDIDDFYDLLDTMSGVTREKSSITGEWIYHDEENPIVVGEIHTGSISGDEIDELKARYPYINITADHISVKLRYWSQDGQTLLKTENVVDGADGVQAPTATKAATAQYTYTHNGWSLYPDQEVNDSNALRTVTANRDVYATFSKTVNTYTVTWKNADGTVLETDTNVPYGTTPTYDGATPTQDGETSTGWTPQVGPITGNTVYTAIYIPVYTATFVRSSDDGGGTLWSGRFQENTTPVYGGSTPTTTQGDSTEFEFIGWEPALGPITQDTTYTAKFQDMRALTIQFLARTMKEYEG